MYLTRGSIAAALSVAFANSLTLAQSAGLRAPDKTVTEEVVVQGTKQNLTQQEIDVSVEMFDQARLDAERLVDLNDVLLRIPNVSSRGDGGTFAIRGIQRNGPGNAGQGVTSNVYIDGAPLSGTALGRGLTSLWDVQQIEVLRGPQSSVQGRNALAGAIVVTTADPTYYADAKARLTYGSYGTYQLAGAFSAPLIEDQLAFRIAVDQQETDGFIDNTVARKQADFAERTSLRGKVLFEPEAIDGLSLKLTYDYSDSDTGESRPIVSTGFGVTDERFQNFNPFDYEATGRFPQNETQSNRLILDVTYSLNDNWDVQSLFTHESTDVDRLFGLRENFSAFGGITFNQFDEEVSSAEIRFRFDYGGISGVFGGYLFESEADNRRDIQTLLGPQIAPAGGTVDPADAIISLLDGNVTDTRNFAFFSQLRWDIDKHWTLDLGLRYDDEEFEDSAIFQSTSVIPENCNATVPGAVVGAPVAQLTIPCQVLVDAVLGGTPQEPPQSADYDAFLPKVALTYNVSDDLSLFASYQRGYRAGGSFVFTAPADNALGNERIVGTYEPEYLTTFEIGLRSVSMDGAFVANLNVFHSRYDDQQVRLPGADPTDSADDEIVNAAESTLYGLEAMFDYTINQQWSSYLSLGLLETEFDKFPFAVTGPFSSLAGNELPQAPDMSLSASVNWQGTSGWFGNLSFTYRSAQESDVDALGEADFRRAFEDAGLSADLADGLTEAVDSVNDLTGRFGYRSEQFEAYVYATNILDDEAVTSVNYGGVNNGTGRIVLATSETVSTVMPPRMVGIGFDYQF